jgi:hypothetical protein
MKSLNAGPVVWTILRWMNLHFIAVKNIHSCQYMMGVYAASCMHTYAQDSSAGHSKWWSTSLDTFETALSNQDIGLFIRSKHGCPTMNKCLFPKWITSLNSNFSRRSSPNYTCRFKWGIIKLSVIKLSSSFFNDLRDRIYRSNASCLLCPMIISLPTQGWSMMQSRTCNQRSSFQYSFESSRESHTMSLVNAVGRFMLT